MKLSHNTLECPINFDEGTVNVLVVENARQMSNYISQLKLQIEGYDGGFVLSENNSSKPISDAVDLIMDPFSINPNTREIINSIYSSLSKKSKDQDHYLETNNLMASIESYILDMISEQDNLLRVTEEVSLSNILKLFGVKFIVSSESLLEAICDYLDINSKYSKIELFVFVNLKSFLNTEDMSLLYEHIVYNKQGVLLIERNESSMLERERTIIIDQDLCEIHKVNH